jgi:hypothetical protein
VLPNLNVVVHSIERQYPAEHRSAVEERSIRAANDVSRVHRKGVMVYEVGAARRGSR